ncbi:RNA-directed DNA polymerase, eukaryota [Tanacetum coccineum]
MESLHLSFDRVIRARFYNGIHIADSLCLSHLFYADDVVFIGKWSLSNLSTIVNVLNCKVLFIWTSFQAPFNYLGVKVGGIMTRLSAWEELDIVRRIQELSNNGIDLLSLIKKKVGNGVSTSFWEDVWLADSPLKNMYPRLYLLEADKHSSVASKLLDSSLIASFRRHPRGGVEEEQLQRLIESTSSIILPNSRDRWIWRLDSSGEFSVKSARNFIDDSFLPKMETPTRWVKTIPIKINIFAWKVFLDKLPTRLNLSLRGIDIPSIICPLCSITVESTSHLFFSCHLARQLLIKVARWWELEIHDFTTYDEWLFWLTNLRVSKGFKNVFEGVCYTTWWVIWKFRNQVLFGNNFPRLDLLFDEIVRLSFNWVSSRCKPSLEIKNPSFISL